MGEVGELAVYSAFGEAVEGDDALGDHPCWVINRTGSCDVESGALTLSLLGGEGHVCLQDLLRGGRIGRVDGGVHHVTVGLTARLFGEALIQLTLAADDL